MNAIDFQRNFTNSYFGLVPTAAVRALLPPELSNVVNDSDLIPCTLPKYPTNTTVSVTAIIKKDKTYYDPRINLPWKIDMDEDREQFRTGIPSPGMIQIDDCTVYLSRAPIRDTPRGYAPGHHSVHTNWPGEVYYGCDSYEVVWNIFNKTRNAWNTALYKVTQGDVVSMAVDRFVSLGALPGRRYTQILYKAKGSVGFINQLNIPVLFPEHNTYMLYEYIQKVSGVQPIIK
jgi:hypothetical protein